MNKRIKIKTIRKITYEPYDTKATSAFWKVIFIVEIYDTIERKKKKVIMDKNIIIYDNYIIPEIVNFRFDFKNEKLSLEFNRHNGKYVCVHVKYYNDYENANKDLHLLSIEFDKALKEWIKNYNINKKKEYEVIEHKILKRN